MKKFQVFLIYILVLIILGFLGYYLSIYLFRFFTNWLFICPYDNPTDFDCAYPAIQNGLVAIILSGFLIIILGYFIFKYSKKYINIK